MRRCPKVVSDYDGWLQRNILLLTRPVDNDTPAYLTKVKVGKPFDHELKLPQVYTTLAKKFYSFSSNKFDFYFDYKNRIEYFKDINLSLYEQNGAVVIGAKGKTNVLVVDADNAFYQYKDGVRQFIGTIEDVLDIDVSNRPQPYAEVKVNGRSVPVGVMLSYMVGFEKLMELLTINYRTIDKAERYKPQSNEYVIRTRDVKVIIEVPNQTINYLIGGFSYFKDALLDVDLSDLNKQSGYSGLF